jgi:hypothetical protein
MFHGRTRLALAFMTALAASTAYAAPTKIWPLGDSITGLGCAYRQILMDRVIAAGQSVTAVGTMMDGCGSGNRFDSYSGKDIQYVDGLIGGLMSQVKPDMILLDIGTNNMFGGGVANATAAMNKLLDDIYAAAPNVWIILTQIGPITRDANDADVRAFDASLVTIVDARAKQGRHIAQVDVYHALTGADLADGIHPNSSGYVKIANVFYPAVIAALGGNSPSPDAGAPRDAGRDLGTAGGSGGGAGATAGAGGAPTGGGGASAGAGGSNAVGGNGGGGTSSVAGGGAAGAATGGAAAGSGGRGGSSGGRGGDAGGSSGDSGGDVKSGGSSGCTLGVVDDPRSAWPLLIIGAVVLAARSRRRGT